MLGLITAASFAISVLALPSIRKSYNTKGGPKDGVLNVHMIPHSHDDVGWLKTYDEYFTDAKIWIQDACVKCTLDDVTHRLSENKDRKFVEVEMAFFWLWWNQASNYQKAQIKEYLKSGQLEFIGGGWSMNDEGAVHFISTIDNMSLGHRFIADTFGAEYVPTIGWQIDPFGHSSFMASCFADLGFLGEFFARIDYGDRSQRYSDKGMEFIWRGSPSRGVESDIFTQAFHTHYSPIDGFDFENPLEEKNNPDIIDLPLVGNVKSRVEDFVTRILERSSIYRSNHYMTLMGNDFTYKYLSTWQDPFFLYYNMDLLIHYVNQDGRLNLFYSTPSIYTKSVNDEVLAGKVNFTDTLKTDDLMPYADNKNAYWSGYFTTRPSFKRLERRASNFLMAARQLEVVTGGKHDEGMGNSLDNFERALGIAQHHDAITGNNKELVAQDYSQRLHRGVMEGVEVIKERVGALISTPSADLCHCMLSNQTRCECTSNLLKSGQAQRLIVYNSLSQERSEVVAVPVSVTYMKVLDAGGAAIPSQIIPTTEITKNIPAESSSGLPQASPYMLYFNANSISPAGFSTFVLTVTDSTDKENAIFTDYLPVDLTQDISIQNGNNLNLNFINGKLSSVDNKENGQSVNLSIDYLYYKASCNNGQNDGEYIFRPQGEAVAFETSPSLVLVAKGNIVTEVFTQTKGSVSSIIRIRHGEDFIEIESTVDSIDINDGTGREVILRYSTNLETASKMYSDSNGRDMIERTRDYRPTWNLDVTDEPVARNYFPVNAAAYLVDANNQFNVLVDRSEGVASLKDGEIEFMLHRRLTCDDHRGAGESLNEIDAIGQGLKVRVSHYISLSGVKQGPFLQKTLQAKVFSDPILVYSAAQSIETMFMKNSLSSFQLIGSPLPPSISLITVQDLGKGRTLIRLAHLFEKDEDSVNSAPVTIDLAQTFPFLKINKVSEMNLSGVIEKKDMKKLNWGFGVAQNASSLTINNLNVSITIKAMEIKTIIIE